MNSLVALSVFSALVASINPCTLAVLIMSVSSLIGKGKHPRHIGLHTALFGLGVFATYGLLGIVLTLIFSMLPIGLVGLIALVVGVVITVFGLLEVKDYFWYGKGLSFKLSKKSEAKIHSWTKQHHSHFRGFMLGVYTALKLSHYTLILVAMNSLIVSITLGIHYWTPIVWAFAYALPLLVIALLTMGGANAHSLLSWKEQSKHTMRLSIGLLYVLFGWITLVMLAGGLKLV